jgi:hypothetical protein
MLQRVRLPDFPHTFKLNMRSHFCKDKPGVQKEIPQKAFFLLYLVY